MTHTQGGSPMKSAEGQEPTWCLMEHWMSSIYQPDAVSDSPAIISTAHNSLCWINNGDLWGRRAPLPLTTKKMRSLCQWTGEACQLNDEWFCCADKFFYIRRLADTACPQNWYNRDECFMRSFQFLFQFLSRRDDFETWISWCGLLCVTRADTTIHP